MTNLRKIQSFVKRSGRLTPSQEKGLTGVYGVFSYAKGQEKTTEI
jgi:hypothetical protein